MAIINTKFKSKKITKAKQEKYLADSNLCPHCNSHAIYSDEFNADCNLAWRDVFCHNCNTKWRELFSMTGIEEIS